MVPQGHFLQTNSNLCKYAFSISVMSFASLWTSCWLWKRKRRKKSTLRFILTALVFSVIFQCSVCSTTWNYFPLYIYICIYIPPALATLHSMWDLSSPPGMEPTPLALEAQRLNRNHQGSPWNALHWFCPVPNTQSHKYWRVLSMFPPAINRVGLVLILLGRSLDLTLCNLISLKAIVCLQCPQATSGLIFHSCI